MSAQANWTRGHNYSTDRSSLGSPSPFPLSYISLLHLRPESRSHGRDAPCADVTSLFLSHPLRSPRSR